MRTRRLLWIAALATLIWGCPQQRGERPTPKATTNAATTQAKPEPTPPKAEAPKPKAPKAKPNFPDDMAPGETKSFGSNFTVISGPTTLAKGIDAAKANANLVKIKADIESVCQVKGCWMVLKQDGVTPVRVRMKDYSFFVPKNVKGANATVEGVLTERVVPQKEAQHYADDEAKATGKPPKKIVADQKGFQLMASAITITMPPKP